ncbi:MAG: putative DNA binding domain-containing protein [Bifidobacterium sp.]|jgi:ATP-dependent DNA helicase RecG|nr:putative DNA binding domain-containing protein [Bifidobacterium sp.]MCH4175160.1 putative DNA binding domain-containing protein [Bifidobacterium sp.]
MHDDDYTAKMTELIELMRIIGNDTQLCEVKESKRKLSSSITDTLSAFSNGSGGYIILGLSEKAGFTPVEGFNARSMQEALSQACEKMTPVVRPTIMTCPFEGSNLVFAQIDEMLPRDKPCFVTTLGAYSGSFIRTGDGDRRMTGYEVERLMEEHAQPAYDAEMVQDATIDDLNPALVHGLLERQREAHPNVFKGHGDGEMLRELRILALDSADEHDDEDIDPTFSQLRPTLGALLALGRYPQQFYPRLNVTIAVFPGTSRAEVFAQGGHLVAAESITGPIPVMIDDAVESLMTWTAGPTGTDSSSEGTHPPDYPRSVLREAIANALMHRDYSPHARGTQVRVNVFTNRIEVINPGGLYGTVTHNTLVNPISPSTRNQFLVAILEATPYPDGGYVIENGGSGYQQIEAALRIQDMEPADIEHTIDSFKLTINHRRAFDDMTDKNYAQRIVKLLEERPSASVRDIMLELHLSPIAVATGLRALLNKGLVESINEQPRPQKQYRLLR